MCLTPSALRASNSASAARIAKLDSRSGAFPPNDQEARGELPCVEARDRELVSDAEQIGREEGREVLRLVVADSAVDHLEPVSLVDASDRTVGAVVVVGAEPEHAFAPRKHDPEQP